MFLCAPDPLQEVCQAAPSHNVRVVGVNQIKLFACINDGCTWMVYFLFHYSYFVFATFAAKGDLRNEDHHKLARTRARDWVHS